MFFFIRFGAFLRSGEIPVLLEIFRLGLHWANSFFRQNYLKIDLCYFFFIFIHCHITPFLKSQSFLAVPLCLLIKHTVLNTIRMGVLSVPPFFCFCFQNMRNIFRLKFSLRYSEQSSNHSTYHIIKESIRRYGKQYHITCSFYPLPLLRFVPYRPFCVGLTYKRRKIMGTNIMFCSFIQLFFIQSIPIMMGIAIQKGSLMG